MRNYIKIAVALISFFTLLNTYALTQTGTTTTNSGTTNSGAQINSFKLLSVETVYDDEYKLLFNKELYRTEGLARDIQINDLNDNLATFNIVSTTVSGSTLNIKLDKPLKTDNQYEAIAIEIYTTNLETIDKGVNATVTFTTPKVFNVRPKLDITNTGSSIDNVNTWGTEINTNTATTTNTGENIELNAASDVNLESIFKDLIPPTTNNVKEDPVLNNAVQEAKKLPVTGPAEWLLLAIALFFGLIFITFRRKNIS